MNSKSKKIEGKLEFPTVGDSYNTDKAETTILMEIEPLNVHFQVSVILVDFLIIRFPSFQRKLVQQAEKTWKLVT